MDAIVERQIGWNGIARVPELSISITVISRLPSYRLTSEPGSPVPERVGVLSLVIRALLVTLPALLPTSALTSVMTGTVGAMLSTMIFQLAAVLVLLAASVAVTVNTCAPAQCRGGRIVPVTVDISGNGRKQSSVIVNFDLRAGLSFALNFRFIVVG